MSIEIQLEIGHEASIRARKTHDGFTHDWEVFVRGCDGAEIQNYVEKVVFNLHDSFPKPKRVVKEPPYSVKESGYAGFTFPIDIYLRNNFEPKKIRFNYDIHLQQNGPAIFKVEKEKFVFNNPSEEFRHKLLKGGARKLQTGSASTQELLESRSTLDDKNQMMSKPKLSGSDLIKKHKIKIDEPRASTNSFQDLFGLPITKTSKNLLENKSKDTKKLVEKSNSEKSSSNNKPSPHKDQSKSSNDKKDKDEKKSKDKYKERDRTKEKKSKDKSHSKSPSPKHSPPKLNTPTRPPSPQTNKHSSSYKDGKNSSKDRQNKSENSNKKAKKEKRDSLHKENKRKENEEKSAIQTKEIKNKLIDLKNSREYIKESKDTSPISPPLHKSSDKKEKSSSKDKTKDQTKDDNKNEKLYYDKSEEKLKSKYKKKDKERKDKSNEKSHKADKKKSSSKNTENNEHKDNNLFNLHTNETTHSNNVVINDEKFVDNNNPIHSKFVDEDSSNSTNSIVDRSPPTLNRQFTENKVDNQRKSESNDSKRKEKSRSKEKKSSKDNERKLKRKLEASNNDEKQTLEKIQRVDNANHNNNSDAEQHLLKERQEVEDYINVLRDLQQKIMDLKDNAHLQKVVQLIAETGRFEVSDNTFDFDLCLLERSTVQQLQTFFASES